MLPAASTTDANVVDIVSPIISNSDSDSNSDSNSDNGSMPQIIQEEGSGSDDDGDGDGNGDGNIELDHKLEEIQHEHEHENENEDENEDEDDGQPQTQSQSNSDTIGAVQIHEQVDGLEDKELPNQPASTPAPTNDCMNMNTNNNNNNDEMIHGHVQDDDDNNGNDNGEDANANANANGTHGSAVLVPVAVVQPPQQQQQQQEEIKTPRTSLLDTVHQHETSNNVNVRATIGGNDHDNDNDHDHVHGIGNTDTNDGNPEHANDSEKSSANDGDDNDNDGTQNNNNNHNHNHKNNHKNKNSIQTKGDDGDEEETIAAQMAAVAVAAGAQASESPAAAASYAKNLSATIVHLPPPPTVNATLNANARFGAGAAQALALANANANARKREKGIPIPVHTVLVQKYIRAKILQQENLQENLDGGGGGNQQQQKASLWDDGVDAELESESESESALLRQQLARGSNEQFIKHLLMVNHYEFIDLQSPNEQDSPTSPPNSPTYNRNYDNDDNDDDDDDDDSSSSPSQQDQHVSTISFTTQQEEIASKAASHVLDTLEQAEESYNHLLRLIPTTLTVRRNMLPTSLSVDNVNVGLGGSSDADADANADVDDGLQSYDPNSSFTNLSLDSNANANARRKMNIPDLLPTYPSDEGDATNAFFKACAPIVLEEEEEDLETSISRSVSLEVNVGTSSIATDANRSAKHVSGEHDHGDGHGDSKANRNEITPKSPSADKGDGVKSTTRSTNGNHTNRSKSSADASFSKNATNDPPPTLARNLASSFMGSVFSSVNRRRSRKRTDEASASASASAGNASDTMSFTSSATTATSDEASFASTSASTTAQYSPPKIEQHVKIGVDYNVTIVREMLGLTVENVLERTVVRTVLPNGAAKKAGTKVGSLVVKVGTVETKNLTHFETIDELRQSQRPLKLVLRRIGKDSLRGAREEMGRLIKGGGFGICSDHPSTDQQQTKKGQKHYEDSHLLFLKQRWMEATKRKLQNASAAPTKRDEVLSKVGARLAWILSLLVVGLEREAMNLKSTVDEDASYSSLYSDHYIKDFEDAARSVSKILHDYAYKHFERSGDNKQKMVSMNHPMNAAVAKRKKQTAPPEHIQHEQRKAIPGATKRSVQQKARAPGQQSSSLADMALSQIGDVLHRVMAFLADHNSPPAALLRGEVIAILCDILDLDNEMSLSESLSPSDSGNSGLVNDLGSAGNLLKLIVLHCSNATNPGDSGENASHAGNRFLAVVHRLAASRSTSARVTACSLGPVLWGHLDFPHQLQLRGVITRALHDVEVVVRKSTATVLHEIAELVFDSRAVPWLVLMCERAMTDPEPQLRAAAMTLTWHLAEHLPNAFLGDASEGSRSIRGLPSRTDPKFAEVYLLQCKLLPVATRLAEDSAGSVRLAVAAQCDRLAGALGEHWYSVIIDLLQALLCDQDHKVRGEAVMCIPRLVENVLSAESNIAGQDMFVLESLLPVALKLQKDTIDVRMCLAAASGELLSFLVWLYHAEESGISDASTDGNDGSSQKKYIDDTLIPLLQALLHDPEPEVTSAALRAVTNASRGHARDASNRFEDDSVSLSSHQSHLIEKRDPVFRPVLSEDQVLRLVPTLSKLSASTQWRVRQSAVEIVPALLGCTHKLETRSEIAQLCVKLMGDSVDAVRKSAAECLCLGGSNIGSDKSDEADEWLSAVVMPHLEACSDSSHSKQRLLSLKMVEMILINIARYENVVIVKEVHSEPYTEPTLSLTSRALELASTLANDKIVNVRLNVGRTYGNVLSVLNTDDDLEFVISTLESQLTSEKSRENGGDRDVLYFAKKSISLARERIKHLDDVSSLK
jgi:hypothetical protein